MKKLVSLKLSKQSVPTKIENARHYVTVMTGNANFPTPIPTLANVTTAVNNLEASYNAALAGGKVLTAIMRDKEAILNGLLIQLSHYVEATANGNETVILSAGMDVRVQAGGRRITGFTVQRGEMAGEIKLSTPAIPRNAYVWEMVADPLPVETEEDPEHTWEQIGISITASFIKEGLEIGKKFWFRVASIGKDGQSAWSDPLPKVIFE